MRSYIGIKYPLLTRSVSELHDTYPNIKIQLKSGYSSELIDLLHRGEVDLCITTKREGEHNWLTICEDDLTAWVPADNELAKYEVCPLEAFKSVPYIEFILTSM